MRRERLGLIVLIIAQSGQHVVALIVWRGGQVVLFRECIASAPHRSGADCTGKEPHGRGRPLRHLQGYSAPVPTINKHSHGPNYT